MYRSPQGEDALVRGLSVLCNAANQLYYPCEHLAWAADVGIVRAGSQKWWARSTVLWGCALLLSILRYGGHGHGRGGRSCGRRSSSLKQLVEEEKKPLLVGAVGEITLFFSDP